MRAGVTYSTTAAAMKAKNAPPTLAPMATAPLDAVDFDEEDAAVTEAVLRVDDAPVGMPAEVMAAVELEYPLGATALETAAAELTVPLA